MSSDATFGAMHAVIQRTEMLSAQLTFGSVNISLAEYATTGLLSMGVGPRGCGKTNVGQVMAEQLSGQGWVAVIFDPEGEMELMYGEAVTDPEDLREKLTSRNTPIIVVRAANASEFVPYGRVVLEVADKLRKPMLVVVDEGQVFSAPRKRSESLGEAVDLINEFADRGRKRAVDLYMTALRYTGSVHRTLFSNTNLTFIGCQNDAAGWSALSPQFKSAGITFGDLNSLAPAEFFCISRFGIEKVKMQMAEALKKVAPAVVQVKRNLPATYSQWDRAMREIPTERLQALSEPVTALLGQIAGLTAQQMMAGQEALVDELECR
ncbi:ATP-binding protein [Pelomonas sp. APW6]|uniref:ATP-binding protein n=1 Tax=Roseateles subflavus TaxID=3053353 RepID=A0ABT7LNB6_9BURK|nr:ATP-binding protein [Pelomonas sp. APW6]MDL5034369.1 ATP-binding protein [Pelomonas sp. APW6]